jgi:hypothetical protein
MKFSDPNDHLNRRPDKQAPKKPVRKPVRQHSAVTLRRSVKK